MLFIKGFYPPNCINTKKKLGYKLLVKADIYDNLKGIANYADKLGIKDGDYDLIISSSDPKSSHLFVNNMFERKLFLCA